VSGGGIHDCFWLSKNRRKAKMKQSMDEKSNEIKNLIILGSYPHKDSLWLLKELQNRDILCEMHSPSANSGRSEWLASIVSVENDKLAEAIKTCQHLGLPFDAKPPDSEGQGLLIFIVCSLIFITICVLAYIHYFYNYAK